MSKELLVSRETQLLVLARLEGTGLMTPSAACSSYDDTFPNALDGIVSRKDFKFCIDIVNETAEDYFPCAPCYACGYFCCVTTFGLSIFLPEPCTKEWEENVEHVVRKINQREDFLYRGIVWRLQRVKRSHTSWIEICQIVYE
ncbi:TPA: hypothetical protein N0F65_010131 [Lagenidium giganteum]|uniref:Golgin subfamily A member 7/ERF4 domain-containing protein n=1 Tax=Lagenidium giganteum TaxID=4803 RepID=A0AAV2Z2Y3_9STRA|nr:TPA: hypothetical protein N0F65_010131 [Lagenidium giganteum]